MASNPTAPKTKKKNFSWSQPCCDECWDGLKLKTGRLTPNIEGICCFCKNELDTDKTREPAQHNLPDDELTGCLDAAYTGTAEGVASAGGGQP